MRTLEVLDQEIDILATALYERWHEVRDYCRNEPSDILGLAELQTLENLYKRLTGQEVN